MNIVQAIEIKTNVTIENSFFGLYAVSGETSEFRFSECVLSGAPKTYKDGFILKNGIGNCNQQIDLLESGGVVQSTDITIRLKNVGQLSFFIDTNSISLYNCEAKIIEFVGTDSDADSIDARVVAVRTIEQVIWSDTDLTLKVKMSFTANRNKMLSSRLDIANYPYVPENNKDKFLPVIFGVSDPKNGRYFKILQSANKNDILRIIDTPIYDSDKTYNPYSYKFPLILNSTDSKSGTMLLGYAIDADNVVSAAESISPDWLEGLYLFCVNGATENQNSAREITSYFMDGELMPDTRIYAQLVWRDYLPTIPSGNSTFNATDQTYFELHDVDIKYITSHYDILGFYDSETEIAQAINYDIYGNVGNDVIEKLMTSSYELDTVNNIIDLNPRIFNNSELTKLLNYDCYPASRIDKMVREDFDAVGNTGYDVLFDSAPFNPVPGLNCTTLSTPTINNTTGTVGFYFNATDRQTGSGHRWINVFGGLYAGPALTINTIEIGYKVFFPELPDSFKFSKCYLGLNLKTTPSATSHSINMESSCRIYLQQSQTLKTDGGSGLDALNIDNIPDFYYLTNPDTGNYNFFYEQHDITSAQLNVRGHKGFEINVSSINDIKNIGWVGIIVEVNMLGPYFSIESIFEEACFIFEREQDIGNEFYV